MEDGRDALHLVTKKKLARQMGKTVRTVNKMIARSELPRPFKLGATAYWRLATLDRHLSRLEREMRR